MGDEVVCCGGVTYCICLLVGVILWACSYIVVPINTFAITYNGYTKQINDGFLEQGRHPVGLTTY